MYEQSTNILDQARFVTVCKTIFIQLLYVSSTVCYSLVRLNTTFTRLTGHLQGLHTVPRLLFEFDSIRFIYDIDTVKLTRGVGFMCGCIYGVTRCHTDSHGLVRSHTVSHSLVRSLIRLYTVMGPVLVF